MASTTSKWKPGKFSSVVVVLRPSTYPRYSTTSRDGDTYKEVQNKIDKAPEKDRIGPIHITYKEATPLSYLQVCMEEAAQDHPIVALPRKAPPLGYTVPGAVEPKWESIHT